MPKEGQDSQVEYVFMTNLSCGGVQKCYYTSTNTNIYKVLVQKLKIIQRCDA